MALPKRYLDREQIASVRVEAEKVEPGGRPASLIFTGSDPVNLYRV